MLSGSSNNFRKIGIMLKIRRSNLTSSIFTFVSSSFFFLASSEIVLGSNSPQKLEIENSTIVYIKSHSEVRLVSFKQNNICEQVKRQLPAIEKNLDRTMTILQPLVEKASKYIEDNTTISPDEIESLFQQGIEKTPRRIAAFFEDREITVKYYSTHSPLPFVLTEDCELEPNLSRRISAPGGYVLIKYEPK